MSTESKLRLRAVLAGLAAVPLLAGSAAADKLVFSGTHEVLFTPNFAVANPTPATGPGVATVNGGTGGSPVLSTLQLGEHFDQIDTALLVAASAPLAAKIPEIRLTGVRIDPQAFGGLFAPIHAAVTAPGALNPASATMPGAGQIKLCGDLGCPGTATTVSTALSGHEFDGSPVGIGVGGAFAITRMGASPFTIVFNGAPWTPNQAAVTYSTSGGGTAMMTATGTVRGSAKAQGTTLTPSSNPMSGTVQLVTPVQIQATGLGQPHNLSGMIIRLTLHFQPEPGRLALLGCGALGLAGLGWRRRRALRP